MKTVKEKPKGVQFCWVCGRQLYQRNVFYALKIDGYERILHKSCARGVKRGMDYVKRGDQYVSVQWQTPEGWECG